MLETIGLVLIARKIRPRSSSMTCAPAHRFCLFSVQNDPDLRDKGLRILDAVIACTRTATYNARDAVVDALKVVTGVITD